MVQGLLLDRIYAESAAPAVAGEHDLVPHPLPRKAKPPLAPLKLADARAQVAFKAAVRPHD
jgi:hypothetical protein